MRTIEIFAILGLFFLLYFMASDVTTKIDNMRIKQELSSCRAERDELSRKK